MQDRTEPRPTDETPIRYTLTTAALVLLADVDQPIPFELVQR